MTDDLIKRLNRISVSPATADEAAKEIERLRAENAALAQDAARYRFVEPMIGGDDITEADRRTLLIVGGLMKGMTTDQAVDAAIDEAMK